MAELFIELFSEEIPSTLQIDARRKIIQMFKERLQKREIKFNSQLLVFYCKPNFFKYLSRNRVDREIKLACLPSINTKVAKEETSSGLPSQITRSAALPTSMVPNLSERPKTSAILAVNAFIASS